jgi:phosphoglycolate phosphatase-like HAD superfamily hydrolase
MPTHDLGRVEGAPAGLAQAVGRCGDAVARLRLVLFDIDGTLIHTGGVGVKAFARALESEFGRANGTERIKFGGRTDTSLVRELFGHAGIEHTPEHVRRFFDAYVFWLDHLLTASAGGGACAGVLQFLEDLRGLPGPPRLGLLTGNIRLGAEIKLRRYHLWHEFEMGGFGDDDEDRNGIARMARQRGAELVGDDLRGNEILVVGDTPRDIECGRAIEARVLAVGTGGSNLETLAQHQPDWLVPSLQRDHLADLWRAIC